MNNQKPGTGNGQLKYRMEKDFLGEKEVPEEAYWGIHTRRALENFPLSPMIVTAFLPHIGYDRASEILQAFLASGGKNVREFLQEKLGMERVERVLSPERLISLGYREDEENA